ncbi:MAG: DUF5682 family protein, partial [Acidobacteriota bacterium]
MARRLAAAGHAGLTIETATVARVLEILDLHRVDRSGRALPGLPSLLRIFHQVLRAGLGGTGIATAGESIASRLAILLDQLTVSEGDLDILLEIFPNLVRLEEYGSIHQQGDPPIDLQIVATIVDRTINRLAIGLARLALPGSPHPTPRRLGLLVTVDQAMGLAGRQTRAALWTDALRHLADLPSTAPSLAARAAFLLWQAGSLPAVDLEKMIGRALSPARPVLDAAAWVEGFFRQAGGLLMQDLPLLEILDQWLARLDEPQFISILPLLRRTFSTFSPAERRRLAAQFHQQERQQDRQMGHQRGSAPSLAAGRAELVLPLLNRLRGLDPRQGGSK